MSTDSIPQQVSPIGRGRLTALALSSFIPASGMATVPLVMLASAGYGSWLAAAVAAIVTVLIGFAVIVFARRYVMGGSLYSYVGVSLPSWARYITGGSLLLGYIAQLAAASLLLSVFLGSVLSSFGWTWTTQPLGQLAIIVVMLAITLAIVLRGLDVSVFVAVLLAAISVPFMIVIAVGSGVSTGLELGPQLSLENSSVAGIFAGVAAGAGFLFGFESCAALAEETKNPKRTVPWAVMSVPICLGILYVFTTLLSVPGLMEAGDLLAAGVSAPSALAQLAGLPSWFGPTTDIVLSVSIFAGLIGFTNYGARFVATLAGDGLLPRSLTVHNHRNVPGRASTTLAVTSAVALALVLLVARLGLVEVITAAGIAIVFSWIPPYLLIGISALKLLARERSLRPLTAIAIGLGVALVAWVLISNLTTPSPAPLNAVPYVVLIAIALLVGVFVLFRRAARRGDD